MGVEASDVQPGLIEQEIRLRITRTPAEVDRIRTIANHIAISGDYSSSEATGVALMADWLLGNDEALSDIGIQFGEEKL